MKDFLFRVWDIKGKKLHYPGLISISSIGACRIGLNVHFLPGDCIIQQFTGLRDKNNRPIYEGDIISYSVKVGKIIKQYFVCKYKAPSFVFESNGHDYFMNEEDRGKIKVEGNVFEDKGLLV